MTEDANQNLVRIKADVTGVDLSVGRSLPDLVARLLPLKFRIRRSVDEAIGVHLLEKIHSNDDFDEAEHAFAEEVLSEHAIKYIRLKRIQERALVLSKENPSQRLLEAGMQTPDSPPKKETSDDWLNKFREDASLVDDDMIGEIYARIINEESQRPTAFSLRTLGVLRYLDRETAIDFERLQKFIIDGHCVPQHRTDDMLFARGLAHTTMLTLDDAGLVNASTASISKRLGRLIVFRVQGQFLAVRRYDHRPMELNLKVHLLTPAGEQLAKIVHNEFDESAFQALAAWILTLGTDFELLRRETLPEGHEPEDLPWERVGPNRTPGRRLVWAND